MKLSTRVALAVAAVTVGALTAESLAILFLVRRDEMADLDRALVAQAELAARLADMEDVHHPVLEPGHADVPEHYRPAERYVVVYGPQGRVRTATSTFGVTPPPTLPELGFASGRFADGTPVDLTISGNRLRGVLVRMPVQGYSLLYAASRREVDVDVLFLARVLAALLVAVTALTTVVASWLGRRLSRDVQKLALVARDVAEGDLDARAGTKVTGSLETTALAHDLDKMIENLSALVVAQRTFVSHAAHELMSPLTTLRGELQLALRHPHTTKEYESTIDQALRDVESLVLLSEDLLTLARVTSTSSRDQRTSVGHIVAVALRASKGAADARSVRVLDVRPDPTVSDVEVIGASRELARALRNVVDNAVAHSDTGGEVRISSVAHGDGVRVAVEDSGPGVPPSDRSHIFEPFFRGARDRGETDQGVGLGLAIARQIARRYGGDVALDPRAEHGARFVLTLKCPSS